MNRRSFMKSILAAGVAPYVCTSAGVLMPVRSLWEPPVLSSEWYLEGEGKIAVERDFIATVTADGITWRLKPGDEVTIGDPKNRYVVVANRGSSVVELMMVDGGGGGGGRG